MIHKNCSKLKVIKINLREYTEPYAFYNPQQNAKKQYNKNPMPTYIAEIFALMCLLSTNIFEL